MAATIKDLGLDRLSVNDRLALMEELWDSLTAEVAQLPLTEAQQRELERRLGAHKASPGDVIPWEEVKARALARAKK